MISCLHTITKLSAKNAQRLQRQIHQFYLNDRGKHAETYAKTHAKDKVRGSNASAKQNRKEKGSRTTLASSPLPREVSLLGWRLILSRFYLPGVQRSTENTKNHSFVVIGKTDHAVRSRAGTICHYSSPLNFLRSYWFKSLTCMTR